MQKFYEIISNSVYGAQAIIAIWGAYCVVMVWARVKQKRFQNEEAQSLFLEALEEPLAKGDYEAASQVCADDRRALCQLCQLAIDNRRLGYAKTKQLVGDRFQRDVLSDLEHRLSWVYTVIKAAPMLGLLGTVLGMMAAFKKLSAGTTPDPTQLAGDIMFALITTAIGLATAIPFVLATTFINEKIERMKDLVAYGLNQFMEIFREALIRHPR
jgi:biopolymer transport protein ExbB/TolQ